MVVKKTKVGVKKTINQGYIVNFIPKYKGSGYPYYSIVPLTDKIWTKERALKDAKFHLNYTLSKTGIAVKDAYKYKIVKAKKLW